MSTDPHELADPPPTPDELAHYRRGAQDASDDVAAGVTVFRDVNATTVEPGYYWRGYYTHLAYLLKEDA